MHDIKVAAMDNELLSAIWKRQEAIVKQNPEADLLLVLDDCSNRFKSKEMVSQLKRFYQLSRHVRLSIITCAQSLVNYSTEQIGNASSWIIFRLNQRDLKKVSESLATNLMDKDDLQDFISRNTKEDYSWVMIDLTADDDDKVYQAFDPKSNSFHSGY